MSINLDPTIAREIEQGMANGGGVELPFAAPYLWVVNGNLQLRSVGGALLFGGWATKAEDMDTIAEQNSVAVPAGFAKQSIGTRDGGDFDAYTTRYVMVAPMGLRASWIVDGMHQPEYKEGARRHLQVLCYLASRQGQNGSTTYAPWGPVVLTAKGFQARNLMDSFTAWNRHSQQARKKFAPGIPAWCFYVAVGTFGDKPVTKMVGKGSQSPITPIGPYLPKDVGEKELTAMFTGQEVAADMVEYRKQAHEWLSAWNEPAEDMVERDAASVPEIPEAPPEEEEAPF